MYARALDPSISTGQYQFFSTGQNGQMESDLENRLEYNWLQKLT